MILWCCLLETLNILAHSAHFKFKDVYMFKSMFEVYLSFCESLAKLMWYFLLIPLGLVLFSIPILLLFMSASGYEGSVLEYIKCVGNRRLSC